MRPALPTPPALPTARHGARSTQADGRERAGGSEAHRRTLRYLKLHPSPCVRRTTIAREDREREQGPLAEARRRGWIGTSTERGGAALAADQEALLAGA